ncbi:MAG: PAS domain S-box protein, partial [Spirochaetaceae bacterium]
MPREKGKTILLVEDDPIIALAERKILERQGYTVITARTGEDAIEVVRTTDGIDLILMDINLGPGIDGTEAAEIILAREEIPLVFLSSHTEPEVVAKTEGITSYGYVVKNSGETVLMASIKMAFRLFAAREREREARAQLRRQNEFLRFYRVAVDGMSDYRIAVTDREYRYRIVSRHYLENYNLTEEEILGKTVAQVMGEDVFRKFIKPRTDLALSGQRVETSRWFDHPARGMGRRYINVMYYPIFDELPGDRREVSAVAVVVRDVTREKEADKALKKSEERFRTLADDLPAMICEYLPDSTLTYVNRAYCEYHGMKREEMVGTQFLRFIPPENREAAQQTYLALTPDRPLNTHTQYVIRNGEVRWQEWRDRAFFNREGKAVRFQAIGIDITERKRAEEAATRLAEWRETMMKEVQHRIKNTMNTMVSMLSLQADTLEDPGAATALNDA